MLHMGHGVPGQLVSGDPPLKCQFRQSSRTDSAHSTALAGPVTQAVWMYVSLQVQVEQVGQSEPD